jgi:hypothetical protein
MALDWGNGSDVDEENSVSRSVDADGGHRRGGMDSACVRGPWAPRGIFQRILEA